MKSFCPHIILNDLRLYIKKAPSCEFYIKTRPEPDMGFWKRFSPICDFSFATKIKWQRSDSNISEKGLQSYQ